MLLSFYKTVVIKVIISVSPLDGAPSPQFGTKTDFKSGAIRVSAAQTQAKRTFLL